MTRTLLLAMAFAVLAAPGCSDDDDDDDAAVIDPGPGPGPTPDPDPDPDPEPEPEPDPGHGWVVQRVGGMQATGVSAADANHVWVTAAADGMFVTQNGGTTWTTNHDIFVVRVQFLDSQNGWGALNNGTTSGLHSTSDGGATWTYRGLNALMSKSFLTPQLGWVFSGTSLFKTSNGGESWSETTFDFDIYGVRFVDPQNGWMTANSVAGIHILRSTDGGATWQERHSAPRPNDGFFVTEIAAVSPTRAWAVANASQSNTLFSTTDGGATWTEHTINDGSKRIAALHFANANVGWAVGSQINYTTDGGATWTLQTMPPPHALTLSPSNPFSGFADIEFIDEKTGWAVGDNGVILKTTNGGK